VWAREHGSPWGRAHDGEEGEDSCALAAEGGHLEVLHWAREHSAPWNEQTFAPPLSWAREHDCPWDYDTCAAPSRAGTWKWFNGRGRTTPRGVRRRVTRPLWAGTWS